MKTIISIIMLIIPLSVNADAFERLDEEPFVCEPVRKVVYCTGVIKLLPGERSQRRIFPLELLEIDVSTAHSSLISSEIDNPRVIVQLNTYDHFPYPFARVTFHNLSEERIISGVTLIFGELP